MLYIGIDYSINSPAACVLHDGKIDFFSFARSNVAKEVFFENLSYFKVKIINTKPMKNSKILLESSRESILDSIQVAQNTIQGISDVCGIGNPNENVIAIEGFSFGSTGNRLAQLSGYQYVLRMHLLSKLISPVSIENMWIFAPATVKATAKAGGKGKGKIDMIQSFIEHEDKLPGLEDNPFYQELCKNPETFQDKKGRFIKPVDDLIDAYFILKTYFKKTSLA
jgi:hypothetical protein